MRLIVGLGNKGREYDNTRHNIGFMMIDEIANYLNVEINNNKFDGLYAQVRYNDENIILLKPQKYMNLSGEVIIKFVNYFKINIEDILIISDDLDMEFCKIKLKQKGSSGGHNGLKNIENHLGTQNYKRLKIGISNDKKIDTKNYVLGKFSTDDLEQIENIKNMMPELFKDYMILEFENLMNKYNKK